MTLEQLQSAHMQQLTQAFGIANAQAVARDSRIARMEGVQK